MQAPIVLLYVDIVVVVAFRPEFMKTRAVNL